MSKQFMYCLLFSLFLTSILLAQPNVMRNEVTLYLSNGEIETGLMIEVKGNVTPNDRLLVIWNQQKGFVTYPFQDIEALTHNYSRDEVARDIGGIKWRAPKDQLVLVHPKTRRMVETVKGLFQDYNNVKGLYAFANKYYNWNEVGAIYFYNSDHSHFTSNPNEFALPPTLLKNVVPSTPDNQTTPNIRDAFRKKRHIVNQTTQRPNRHPDLIVNLPASNPIFKGNDVNTGDRFYIEVNGLIRINPQVEVGLAGFGGDVQWRYKPEAATGVPLVFIAPPADFHVKVPAAGELYILDGSSVFVAPKYGKMCFTVNDSNYKDNAGSFEIKIWRIE